MTTTLNDVAKKKADEQSAEARAAVELVRLAKEQGLSLTGPDGLLKQLTKTVLETALDEEMTEHLGYAKHGSAGDGSPNVRNGTRVKTVLTEASGRWRSRCHGTGRARSSRRSCASGSAALVGLMRWCSRSTRRD